MAAEAMAELAVVAVARPIMFQALGQDWAMVVEADKHLTKAAQHQTVTAMHDLVATAAQILVVVVAMADHITAVAAPE
jgi:hypothetical protein